MKKNHRKTRKKIGGNNKFRISNEKILSVIGEINQELNERCPGLSVQLRAMTGYATREINRSFNPRTSTNIYVLCLYFYEKCISTIEFNSPDENGDMMFESYTNVNMYNRKYNKLLRSILIIILNETKQLNVHINQLISIPMNFISAWSILSTYDAIYDTEDNTDFMNFKNAYMKRNKTEFKLKDLLTEAYEQDKGPVVLFLPINDVNVGKAIRVYYDLLFTKNTNLSLKCPT